MSETLAQAQTTPGRSRTLWWITTIVLAVALLAALVALLLREPETVVRQVPSTIPSGPTPEMLAEVERMDAESAELTEELRALLQFIAGYECPPGTAPSDVEELERLKRKAEAILAVAPGAARPGSRTTAAPDSPLPSVSGSSPSSEPDGTASIQAISDLSSLLEKAVVVVLAVSGEQLAGTGTGFFIRPDLLVTNRHVIDGTDNRGLVFVANEALGDVILAKVVAKSPNGPPGAPDFALLRTEKPVAPATLTFTPHHSKLMEVVVAGYPGLSLVRDRGFHALLKGDLSSAPDMHQNKGEVRSTQDSRGGTAILHTADIQTGYSGGPLIDRCGRVIGINTFLAVDRAQSAKMNSALATSGIVSFLRRNGLEQKPDNRACPTE